MKKLALSLLAVSIAFSTPMLAGCGVNTWPSIDLIRAAGNQGDKVTIDAAVISDSPGNGVSYDDQSNRYTFSVYDKTAKNDGGTAWQEIVVAVDRSNIDFTPQAGDFVKLSGTLQPGETGLVGTGIYNSKVTLMIVATKITRTGKPAGWDKIQLTAPAG